MTGETWTDGERTRDLDETVAMERAWSDFDEETATHESGPVVPRWSLLVREGPEAGREIEIPAGRISVGRSDRCGIRLADPSVSRVHLWLEARPEGVLLFDESTKNGTRLDGAICVEGMAGAGSRISLGRTVLEVRREEPDEAGSVVQQALRVMKGSKRSGRRPSVGWRKLVLGIGISLLVVAGGWIALRPLAAAPEATVDEGAERRREARRAFDRGLQHWRAGEPREAEEFFRLAAARDPGSEEPWRYLRRLEDPVREEPTEAQEEAPPFGDEAATEEVGEAGDPEPPAGGDLPSTTELHPAARVEAASLAGRAEPRARRSPKPEATAGIRGEAAREIEALLARAAAQEGVARVETLRRAWETARGLRSMAVESEIRRRLSRAAFAVGEEALGLGRLTTAVAHFRLALEAEPSHGPARERLAGLKERAERFFVEGYSLLEREPARAKERLELVLDLTEPEDPLHRRAEKWLASAGGQGR